MRAGRDPVDLARAFEPSVQAIRNRVAEADRGEGRASSKSAAVPADASRTAGEREELVRLRRENKPLELERDILSRATAWFARETGVLPSMGSVGDAYDNAMCESVFATLECELLARCHFRSQAEARMAIFSYVEGFDNVLRLHAALGYRSPIAFGKEHHLVAVTAA